MKAAAPDTRRAITALSLMALLGGSLVFLFPGCPEQDTYYHFLIARAAWSAHYFVAVWSRPLFTTVFAFPDLLGFNAGRFFAVAVGVATAWQTWRLALEMRLERAWLVIPLLLAQPVFFELFPDMLTEPLFGLVFVVALRWHLRGWVKRGMLLASLLPLARPEGVFLGVLWGVWVLAGAAADATSHRPVFYKIARTIPSTFLLATGVAVWWLAALCVSGDPLYILHTWPATWRQDVYGRGNIFSYAGRMGEVVGLLAIPFLIGLWQTLPGRRWIPLTSSFLMLFLLHSVFRVYGLFGEAGYPRYMVSVAAATAVITLQGWNTLAALLSHRPRTRAVLAWGVLTTNIAGGFVYLDCLYWGRNAIAIGEMSAWLRDHPVPHTHLVWSDARMCIDLGESIDAAGPKPATNDTAANMKLLRNAPAGTLVFWDGHFGPNWYGMTADDIEKCGYRIVRDRYYSLPGFTHLAPYEIEVTLLIKN